ncbi:MAG: hypothetical protein ISS68_02220 [Desulfobacteraceae bacterium]|nr:hypothetical protein [Desulfobacteraceae bacterium]
MRKLLYIPIIHEDADLGSVAASIGKRSLEICGKERWEQHKEIVTVFWDKISAYFREIEPVGLGIYQDGLMADGELGRRIIEEGAKKGSRNYQVVLDLIKRGGEIRKTEDITLLKKEFHRILQLVQTDPDQEKNSAAIQARLDGQRLLKERDRFIAKTINKTLKEQETGVLFLGAFHDILSQLADDIEVREVKSARKVKDYFTSLISGADNKKFNQLAAYLVSDV